MSMSQWSPEYEAETVLTRQLELPRRAEPSALLLRAQR